MPLYEVSYEGSIEIEASSKEQAEWIVELMCEWPGHASFDAYPIDEDGRPCKETPPQEEQTN